MVFIGIGSNLGNRIQNIENAKYNLKINGIDIFKIFKILRNFILAGSY
jgi:7,8-dihydro-6-hydroxymethylpterin-pyrophosphokinase